MMNKKQDLNGVRTPEDVERRHNLGAIPQLEEEVSNFSVDSALSSSSTHAVENRVITNALSSLNNNKVEKVAGKGLSTNDFTNEDKNSIHIHNNKNILDIITQQKIDQWDTNSYIDIYSDDEIKTNKKWFGKDVYRKCFKLTDVPRGFTSYNHNISNFEDLVNVEGHWKGDLVGYGTEFEPLPNIIPDAVTQYSIGISNISSTRFGTILGTSIPTTNTMVVVLEYTKSSSV